MADTRTEITADLLNGLAQKLDGLNLNEAEQAVVDAVLTRAAAAPDDEVSGFWGGDLAGNLNNADIHPRGAQLGLALSIFDADTNLRLNTILERGMPRLPGQQ